LATTAARISDPISGLIGDEIVKKVIDLAADHI
jgi:hypothetical protein